MYALDVNILIYALTNHPEFGPASAKLLRSGSSRTLSASELVAAELLGHNSVHSEEDEVQLREFINREFLRLIPLTRPILYEAARLRRLHRITLADAIHVASAIISGAEAFVTNDQALTKLPIPGIRLLSLSQAIEPVGRP